MRSGRPQDELNNMAHRRYVAWATGDAVKTEFPLPKVVARLDDLVVTVAGLVKRPDLNGAVFDYKVRGLTPGYAGDRNFVKFAAAPAAAAAIGFFVNAD